MPAVCCPQCLKKYHVTDMVLLPGLTCDCGYKFGTQSQFDTQRLATLIERGEPDDMEEIAKLLGQNDPSK